MARYWIGVASREHVLGGVAGGFAQVCHGKGGPLQRMKPDDWLIYYSPTHTFGGKDSCKRFTAIGTVDTGDPYTVTMSTDFVPWRRNVTFVKADEVAIEPLLAKLSFIHDIRRWGFPFRRGCFEINEHDFKLIAAAMGVAFEK